MFNQTDDIDKTRKQNFDSLEHRRVKQMQNLQGCYVPHDFKINEKTRFCHLHAFDCFGLFFAI
jgi:hypothetical protein